MLHGPNITCQPLDISSDWEPVETFDDITDAVPHVTESLATSTSMPVLTVTCVWLRMRLR